MESRSPQARDQMRRQLATQHKQQEQLTKRFRPSGRDLPEKQDQTRHNPVTEAQKNGSFTSDQ